jgi:hypothetical protein
LKKFGKTYWHKNPRNTSLTLYSTNTLNNPRNVRGRKEYVSKKPRRVNRKWEEIAAAFGILSDTTDSSLLEMGIPDKI